MTQDDVLNFINDLLVMSASFVFIPFMMIWDSMEYWGESWRENTNLKFKYKEEDLVQ